MKAFLVVVGILAGLSYFVHDMSEVMLLWRGDDVEPTAEFWVKMRTSYASVAISLFFLIFTFTQKDIVQLVMGSILPGLPNYVFRNVNWMWIFFFFSVAVINYFFVTEAATRSWCLWKLLGSLPLFLVFCIVQLAYFSYEAKKNNIVFEAKH